MKAGHRIKRPVGDGGGVRTGLQNRRSESCESDTIASVMQGDPGAISLDRPRAIVDVNILLAHDDKVLLGRRINTGFGDGCFSPPAGHVELGESVIAALVREAKEEVGIDVRPNDVRFVQVMHNAFGIGRVAFFFEVTEWQGEIVNMEPHKCDELRWFSLKELPNDMVPYMREAIQAYQNGEALTLYGW